MNMCSSTTKWVYCCFSCCVIVQAVNFHVHFTFLSIVITRKVNLTCQCSGTYQQESKMSTILSVSTCYVHVSQIVKLSCFMVKCYAQKPSISSLFSYFGTNAILPKFGHLSTISLLYLTPEVTWQISGRG